MATINVHVDINLGIGDSTVMIFNHNVSYEHYFPTTGDWSLNLDPGVYAVNFAGACPPGGNVVLTITGMTSSNPTMPITATIAGGGHFLDYVTITV
ncbi:MAG TPA: hypothetical protein VK809_03780 [Bacteroidia bacterium]|jgi:hypothetical protein|nr:hypothetical protein [Bacteroidia bacterium]